MMKTLNGYPTKKSIMELCDQHGLRIHAMDSYKYNHSIHYIGEHRNDMAQKVADDIAAEGFQVFFYPYKSNAASCGIIRIEKND